MLSFEQWYDLTSQNESGNFWLNNYSGDDACGGGENDDVDAAAVAAGDDDHYHLSLIHI